MRKLLVFNHISLDGYFTDARGDMSWAHRSDEETRSFAAENAQSGDGPLLFGRVTYQMMAAFWPTPAAQTMDPAIAAGMNSRPKLVASRTLAEATWANTRVVGDDLIEAVRALKAEPGEAITVLGSGTVVAQLTRAGLVDELQLIVNPLVLGAGRTLFEGVDPRAAFRLLSSRAFRNGNVLLRYERAS
jgi:dihydrofolate reductase